MAPALTTSLPQPPHLLSNPDTFLHPTSSFPNHAAPKSIYPDGIKTSGQHPPLYDLLRPYYDFPKEITGPTVWNAEEYRNNPERWTHPFSAEEIEELSTAADNFLAAQIPLTGITKTNFPLPKFSGFLESLRNDLINGKGFLLFKGMPVKEWGNLKSAVAYMGLGTYLGYFVSQNGRGHVLGHVKDVGDDPTQIDKVRIYRTNARQFFHADDSDIVGLLCVAKALEGGESDLVSSHHVWNTLQKEHPDVAEELTKPTWYFDRKGETSKGELEFIRTSVFYLETTENGRVYSKWDPYYVKSLTRFSDAGIIPPLSPSQLRAAQILEDTCLRLSLHMILDIGDIQFLSNAHVLHARTAYIDYPPPAPRRHLMRLWLSTPEDEGGWKLPFKDSREKKRGGIQVDDTPPHAPEDAE
ncbi:taurine catabolism dioxygenase TauD [Delitschia confertaspora ATCC 74209]|uniref:Taurine catabolism dioxygenase TauD n=1 Tax=Delitschia confertaspora ATCC 74209 TaxID=1513339 RepID=A0A9P4JH22_9PLEO|nr:taurine catabolism dioxygenase TauD [Delitschia confertaspora ATCC 74209]